MASPWDTVQRDKGTDKSWELFKDTLHRRALLIHKRLGNPIPESVQDQIGQGFRQLHLAKNVPAQGRGVGLDEFQGHFEPKLFYDSTVLLQASF